MTDRNLKAVGLQKNGKERKKNWQMSSMTKKTVLWTLCFAMLAWQCKAVGNDEVPLAERRIPAFALGHDQHLYGYYPNKHMAFKSDSVYTAQLEV